MFTGSARVGSIAGFSPRRKPRFGLGFHAVEGARESALRVVRCPIGHIGTQGTDTEWEKYWKSDDRA